jgi:hypothetical protein
MFVHSPFQVVRKNTDEYSPFEYVLIILSAITFGIFIGAVAIPVFLNTEFYRAFLVPTLSIIHWNIGLIAATFVNIWNFFVACIQNVFSSLS